MKSLLSTLGHSECASPRSELAYGEEPLSLPSPDFKRTNSKLMAYMNSTLMETLGQLARPGSVRKSNKQRISIIPLTREKVRVGQRGWRRRESRGTTDCTFQHRFSPFSKEAIDNSRSKQYIDFFSMMSFNYNKTKRGSYKIEVLLDELATYFGRHQ